MLLFAVAACPLDENVFVLIATLMPFVGVIEVGLRSGCAFLFRPLEFWKLLLFPNLARTFATRVASFNLQKALNLIFKFKMAELF